MSETSSKTPGAAAFARQASSSAPVATATAAAAATATSSNALAATASLLTPSQTIRAASHNTTTTTTNHTSNTNPQQQQQQHSKRHYRNRKKTPNTTPTPDGTSNTETTTTSTPSPPLATAAAAAAAEASNNPPKKANNNNNNKKMNRNRRQRNKQQQSKQGGNRSSSSSTNQKTTDDNNDNKPSSSPHTNSKYSSGNDALVVVQPEATPHKTNNKKPRSRKKRNTKNNKTNNNNNNNATTTTAAAIANRYPWRKFLPEGSVDPITLDPLDQLLYPPFALAAQEPYTPITDWPFPKEDDDSLDDDDNKHDNHQQQQQQQESEQERQQRVLREQWGQALTLTQHETTGDSQSPPQDTQNNDQQQQGQQRHVNLYDGRALAYYCTSQLQFIDPLNRRDLTRDELLHLDAYLQRHGYAFYVVAAYDNKGVTLSTAGAAAATAAGRAQLLQEQATVLLQALFGGHSVSSSVPTRNTTRQEPPTNTNTLAQQYQAYQSTTTGHHHQRTATTFRPEALPQHQEEDVGIYGQEGLVVIDDDMNPGLRGDAVPFVPTDRADHGTLWSASHIATRHSHVARLLQAQEFPSLTATTTTTDSAPGDDDNNNNNNNANSSKKERKKPLPKAKTLSKISSIVKQTTAEEKRKQWEAREAMKRKAALSNLTFGSNAAALVAMQQQQQPVTMGTIATTTPSLPQPTERQVERNRALADALGVVPSTARQNLNSGWARPTDPLLEFGQELQATIYPDSLILQARERMALVLKMEKKWKAFLEDDKSASLPLQPMDRASRTFVHHYSDFWNLHSESFDPEPRRYIHCVKTRETMAPYPLLSTAARQWTGPRPFLMEHSAQQTSGQATRQVNSRPMPDPPQRQSLQLKPPSLGITSSASAVASTLSGAPSLRESEKVSDRFDGLAPQQRAKLQLQPRTLPTDLPSPFEPSKASSFDVQEALRRSKERMEEKARQDEQMLEAKRKALEAAFASDSEDDNVSAASTDSEEWVEQEPLFQGDENDEM